MLILACASGPGLASPGRPREEAAASESPGSCKNIRHPAAPCGLSPSGNTAPGAPPCCFPHGFPLSVPTAVPQGHRRRVGGEGRQRGIWERGGKGASLAQGPVCPGAVWASGSVSDGKMEARIEGGSAPILHMYRYLILSQELPRKLRCKSDDVPLCLQTLPWLPSTLGTKLIHYTTTYLTEISPVTFLALSDLYSLHIHSSLAILGPHCSSNTLSPSHLRAFAYAVPSAQSTLCELLSPYDPSGKVQREELTCSVTFIKLVGVGTCTQAHPTSCPSLLPTVVSHLKQASRATYLRAG